MPFRATIGGTRTNGAAATSPGMPASPSGSAAKTDRSGRDDAPRPGGIELPRISLPSGGGAIRGVDEKLTTGQPSGTATLAVPVYVSQGRQGAAPALTLRYDSGTGNGPFGIGWTLTVPAITRKTAKNLPRYMDADDSDVFILAGAEDLVPALAQTLSGTWIADTSDAGGTAYSIRRYRPRAESAFARIERWQENASGDVHWRTVTKDNVTSLYGLSIASRIADPADSSRVFSWLVDLSYDDRGNAISYGYKAEDAANVPVAAHEAGRWVGANRYLKTVSYGNDTPYLPPPGDPPGAGLPDQWDFLLVVDYGEHDQAAPRPSEAVTWPCRPDPFSTYRSGFEVRTYRLGRRFLMFHEFPELSADPVLVRSTDLAYSTSADPTAGLPVYSLLSSVTRTGWYRPAGQPDYETKQLPPLRLGYSGFALGTEVQTADPASLENVTGDSGKGGSTWVDLDYLTGKFTSQQLYSWLVSSGSSLYSQIYQLAFSTAQQAEIAYQRELGIPESNYITFGYWDSLRKGLLAGNRLQLAVRQLERAYQDGNRREFEITRHVSLLLHDPAALMALKTTGECVVQLPEQFFDMDYPGHYLRRIRDVSLTIPCVAGPYTNVNCTLTLVSSKVRVDPSTTGTGPAGYKEKVGGDSRFAYYHGSTATIATSHAQDDSGVFTVTFRDDRYLPFETAGAVSTWMITMPPACNAFDFDTITDVVLKLSYTARYGGDLMRSQAFAATAMPAPPQQTPAPALSTAPAQTGRDRLFSVKHEFPTGWYGLLHPSSSSAAYGQVALPISADRFPFQYRGRKIKTADIEVFALLSTGATMTSLTVQLTPAPWPPPANPPVPPVPPVPDPSTDAVSLAAQPQYGTSALYGVRAQPSPAQVPQLWWLSVAAADLADAAAQIEDFFVMFHYSVA